MPLATLRLKLLTTVILILFCAKGIFAQPSDEPEAAAFRPPNVVIILCDDLGYGDIGPFGNRLIKTPHLDQMASEGLKLTAFHAPGNVCTPSRAGILTGRYAIRMGLAYKTLDVQDERGLPNEEWTLAEALKTAGYATACIGKWHLGDREAFHPLKHGFDSFFGLPYSNDIVPLPLYEGEKKVEETAEQATLTERYTQRAIQFISENKERPFFLYLAHTMPHVPLHPSAEFKGKSAAGDYGDVVEELDGSTGRILAALREQGLDDKTVVIFTSDNGPWYEGSAGAERGRKGETLPGGFLVPFIARWPGRIPSGISSGAVVSGLDLMPTILEWAKIKVPEQVELDGRTLADLFTNPNQEPEWMATRPLYLFDNNSLAALRRGPWLLVELMRYRDGNIRLSDLGNYSPGLLFNLELDPSASFSLASREPEIANELSRNLQVAKSHFRIAGEKKSVAELFIEQFSVKRIAAASLVAIAAALVIGYWIGRRSRTSPNPS